MGRPSWYASKTNKRKATNKTDNNNSNSNSSKGAGWSENKRGGGRFMCLLDCLVWKGTRCEGMRVLSDKECTVTVCAPNRSL